MKKVLPTIITLASLMLTGCIIVMDPNPQVVVRTVVPAPVYVTPAPVVVYEPDVYVGAYYVGYYRVGYGYWTGYGWDINFYVYGHAGYGRYYRGAPAWAYGPYRNGGHYRHHHNNRPVSPRYNHRRDQRPRRGH